MRTVIQSGTRFFVEPIESDDANYRLGVLIPFFINLLTKGSGKVFEKQANIDMNHITHYLIMLAASNVTFKGFGANILLQKDQYASIKIAALLCMISFDIGMYFLFQEKKMINVFPHYSASLNKETLIVLLSFDTVYGAAGFVRHQQYVKEREAHSDQAIFTPSTIISKINQFQLPIKFVVGLSCFFYGVMAFENKGPAFQIPLASFFYGIGMALTQGAFNWIKAEKNVGFALYGLAGGISEGFALFSCLKWLPKEMDITLQALIVAISTSTAILLAGNVLFQILKWMDEPSETESAVEIESSHLALSLV